MLHHTEEHLEAFDINTFWRTWWCPLWGIIHFHKDSYYIHDSHVVLQGMNLLQFSVDLTDWWPCKKPNVSSENMCIVISLDPCVRQWICSCFVSALRSLPNSELHIKRCQAFKKVIFKDDILINIMYNDTYISNHNASTTCIFLKSCLSRAIFKHGPFKSEYQ
jgi:hypothetical protein